MAFLGGGILLWFFMIDKVFDVGSEASDVWECNGD